MVTTETQIRTGLEKFISNDSQIWRKIAARRKNTSDTISSGEIKRAEVWLIDLSCYKAADFIRAQ